MSTLSVIQFPVDFREIFEVFFWAHLKTVEIRGFRNLLLLKLADFRKIAESIVSRMKMFSKTFEKTMTLCRFFSLRIGTTKVHCIAMASICSAEQQHSNSESLRIPFGIFSSVKSANSTVFRIRILLATGIFLCKVYHFQSTSQT